MLAAVSDPMMSQCLINHVDRKGPYAGVARVSKHIPLKTQTLILMWAQMEQLLFPPLLRGFDTAHREGQSMHAAVVLCDPSRSVY